MNKVTFDKLFKAVKNTVHEEHALYCDEFEENMTCDCDTHKNLEALEYQMLTILEKANIKVEGMF